MTVDTQIKYWSSWNCLWKLPKMDGLSSSKVGKYPKTSRKSSKNYIIDVEINLQTFLKKKRDATCMNVTNTNTR